MKLFTLIVVLLCVCLLTITSNSSRRSAAQATLEERVASLEASVKAMAQRLERVEARAGDQPAANGRANQARRIAAKADIGTLSTALSVFEIDTARYPTTEEGLAALLVAPPGLRNWNGPYLQREMKDPWGRAYVYKQPGQHNINGFDLSSLGVDGKESEDDITNWDRQ